MGYPINYTINITDKILLVYYWIIEMISIENITFNLFIFKF